MIKDFEENIKLFALHYEKLHEVEDQQFNK